MDTKGAPRPDPPATGRGSSPSVPPVRPAAEPSTARPPFLPCRAPRQPPITARLSKRPIRLRTMLEPPNHKAPRLLPLRALAPAPCGRFPRLAGCAEAASGGACPGHPRLLPAPRGWCLAFGAGLAWLGSSSRDWSKWLRGEALARYERAAFLLSIPKGKKEVCGEVPSPPPSSPRPAAWSWGSRAVLCLSSGPAPGTLCSPRVLIQGSRRAFERAVLSGNTGLSIAAAVSLLVLVAVSIPSLF